MVSKKVPRSIMPCFKRHFDLSFMSCATFLMVSSSKIFLNISKYLEVRKPVYILGPNQIGYFASKTNIFQSLNSQHLKQRTPRNAVHGLLLLLSSSNSQPCYQCLQAHPTALGGFALPLLLQKEEGRWSKVHLPSQCFKI